MLLETLFIQLHKLQSKVALTRGKRWHWWWW